MKHDNQQEQAVLEEFQNIDYHVLTKGINIQLLELVAQGLSNDEISDRLTLSTHTVKHYIDRLRDATGARNRIHLAYWFGTNSCYLRSQKECVSREEGRFS